jgi:hypothetical protein
VTATILLLLSTVAAFAGSTGEANWPRLTAMRMPKAPAIDGIIGAGEWDGATPLSGLLLFPTSVIAPRQPTIRVGWNDAGLLVAIEVPLPPGQKAKATATDWDGTVWQDDSVEVHVDHGHGHEKHYQFVANALGTKLDSLAGDTKYNTEWQAAATNEPGRWTAELAIPWQAMGGGTPSPGRMDGFNVAVNGTTLGGILSWSALTRGLHEPARFGHLVYGDSVSVGLTQLEPARLNEVRGVALGKGETTVSVRLLARTKDGKDSRDGKDEELDSVRQAVGAPGAFTVPVRIPVDQGFRKAGTYLLELAATGPDGLLLVQRGEVEVGAPLSLLAQAFLTEGYLNAVVTADPVVFPSAQTVLSLSVTGARGAKVDQALTPDAASGVAQVRLAGAKLPAGRLTLQATARNRETGQSFAIEKVLDSPLKPAWLGTKEGLTDQVPAPWTPLKVEGDAVKTWGRSYRFDRTALPSEVLTRGASVLAGPVVIRGQVDGKPLAWKGQPARLTARKPNVASLTGRAESGRLTLIGTTTIEYDGMVRVDLSLTPTKGKPIIEQLALEIPLKPEHARYLYHFPGRWGSVDNSGFLPKDGWAHAFKPFVWLGDEDRGFAWFCESDQNWHPADPNRAVEIVREPTQTLLRLNLIGKPILLESSPTIQNRKSKIANLQYTFGFQATPVKQPEKTVWDYRITHHGTYGLESQPAALGGRVIYPAEEHLSPNEGTFECWYRPAFDNVERGVALKDRNRTGNRMIFTVKWEGEGAAGTNCGLYWNEQVQGPVGWSRKDGQVTHNPAVPFDWKAGEWHHLALTWSDRIRLYVDGKLLSETPNTGYFPKPLKDAHIEIGGPASLATIDEVRILSVARPPVPDPAEYQPDAQTLLLDHFEDYGRRDMKPVGEADEAVAFGPGRFGKAPTWEPSQAKTQLQHLAELGVRTVCFHEHWSPYQSHPYVTEENRPRLRSLVDGCHKQKIGLLLYMSRQFADNAPEWELYSEEALQAPRSGAYRRQPEQSAYIACWNGPWKDFCLHHLGKLLDEFGHDGWYLDGPEWPMPCANRHHGCGYVADDGTVHPTYDLFATRDFMKRLYVLTRQRKPAGQLNIHNSTVMVIPTLGWGTSSWGGEQIDAIKPPVKTLGILPMDAFRTEFMGRQWGVPAEFLVYDGMPYYARDVLAYTLLHGVFIRPGDAESLHRTSALWKVHDEFPFKDADMLPYWSNGNVVTCSPDRVHATAYQRPKEGLLLFVSNLGEAEAEATVKLELAKLKLPGNCKAWDALTGAAMAIDGGVLRFPLAAWRYRVVRVR